MLFIVGNWLQKKEREVYKLVTAAGATLLLLLWPTAAATIIATITFAHPIVGAADCCRWILVLILVIEKSQLKSSSLNSEWPVAVISFSFCSVLYIVIVTSLIISSFPISWLIRQLFWGLMNGNFCTETVTVGFFCMFGFDGKYIKQRRCVVASFWWVIFWKLDLFEAAGKSLFLW